MTGSQAAFVALLYVVYRRTGSAAWVSAALLVTFGTIGLLTPLAGSLGDRFDRRRVMIASDLAGAVCFGSLAFVRSPVALLTLAFLAAASESPFFSASSAAVPNLASPDDLNWANGTISLSGSLGHTGGAFLGGALVAVLGASAVFTLNAVSFVVSAALVASVHGRFAGERPEEHEDHHRGLRAGFRFVVHDRVLRTLSIAFLVFVVSVAGVLVAELPLATAFGVGSFGYGMLSASWGAGSLVGTLAARQLTQATERRALVWCSFVTAAALASVSLSPVFVLALVPMVVAGGSDAVVDVAAETLIQRSAPDVVRSRVVAAIDGLIMTGFAGAFLFAGAIVAWVGPKGAYVVAGAGCAVTALLLVPLLRGDREPGDLPVRVGDRR